MNRRRLTILSMLWCATTLALADSIHANADGAYWHHDSGFVFLPAVGEFSLVGIPQDVAGSREAVAYYARDVANERTVVAVNVFPSDPAASTDCGEPFDLADEVASARRAVSTAPSSHASTIRYCIAKRDWQVRVEVTLPSADAASVASIDVFVRGQRWAALASH